MKEQIGKVVDDLKQAIIDDTCGLVEIESLYGDKKGNDTALDFVLKRAEEFGMRTAKTKEGDVALIEMGQGDVAVGMLAHVDVVDVGDLAKWTDPPFKAVVRDGRIYGRGSEDDKGPVIASLYAMRALQLLEVPLSQRIQLIVGTCEEGVWTDIPHFKEQFRQPDYGFSPDAAYPIYNVENGYCDIELHFTEERFGELEMLSAGQSPNSIPSLAEVKLKGKDKAAYQGVAGHSAVPESADNAITKLCKNDPDVAGFNFARFIARFWGSGENPVPLLGVDDGTNLYEGEVAGVTTATPTVMQKTDKGVTININLRQKYGTTRQDIEGAFGKLAAEYHFTTSIPDHMEPMRTSQHQPPFQLMDQVQQEYGLPGGFKTSRGSTYAKTMENFVSWGPVRQDEEGAAHMEDEYISIESMMLSTKMTADWLARTAK